MPSSKVGAFKAALETVIEFEPKPCRGWSSDQWHPRPSFRGMGLRAVLHLIQSMVQHVYPHAPSPYNPTWVHVWRGVQVGGGGEGGGKNRPVILGRALPVATAEEFPDPAHAFAYGPMPIPMLPPVLYDLCSRPMPEARGLCLCLCLWCRSDLHDLCRMPLAVCFWLKNQS